MFRTYEVTIRPQFGSYNDHQTTIEVTAATKAEAISKARKVNARECHYDRFNGRISYSAKEAE